MWRAYSQRSAAHRQHTQQWVHYRNMCKAKRQDNIDKSLSILKTANINAVCKSNHEYEITTDKGIISFYPATGTYQGACTGRGVFNLLKDLENI